MKKFSIVCQSFIGVFVICLGVFTNTQQNLIASSEENASTIVAKNDKDINEDYELEYISIADTDVEAKKDRLKVEVSKNSKMNSAFSDELYFLYTRNNNGNIIILRNLDNPNIEHSYIPSEGYLMEYLGINVNNSAYYDVRFQGGTYAIHGNDVLSFIPLGEIKSFPYYMNDNGIVKHVVENNPLIENSWYFESSLGNAPTWMQQGKKYYSFSGIYFTDSPNKLGNYNQQQNAVNSVPYYDYYLYQPLRTKTSYSATELNQAFNLLVNGETTKMTNTGANFIDIQNRYGTNALIVMAMGIHESSYGRSSFAVNRNNLFGIGAYDSDPNQAAYFPSIENGIIEQGNYLSWVYADADYQTGYIYYGANLGNKSSGMNVKYASDPYWGEKIANHYARIDRMLGQKDYQKYGLAIVRQGSNIFLNNNGTNFIHKYKNSTSSLTYMYPVVIYDDKPWTQIALEPPYDENYNVRGRYPNGRPEGGLYSWFNGYVNRNDIIKVNDTKTNTNRLTITNGDFVFYLNDDGTLRTAVRRSNDIIIKRYDFYPNTKYDSNRWNHVQFEYTMDVNNNITLAKRRANGSNRVTMIYNFYPNTKYDGNRWNHVQFEFRMDTNNNIVEARRRANGSTRETMIYYFYPNAKYDSNRWNNVRESIIV